MPSDLHEVLLELLRAAPHRILDVLRDTTGADVVPGADPSAARLADPTVPQLVSPAQACDLVIEIPAAHGQVAVTIIVEVQLARRRGKELSWPLYWAAARQQARGGLVVVVVITTSASVSRWAARTLAEVIPPAGRGLVIGPGATQPITDPAMATRDPEAVLLSALIHAGHGDLALVPAIVEAYSTLPPSRGMLIQDLLSTRLTREALVALEEHMQKTGYVWKSEFAIRHREEGREVGRLEAAKRMLVVAIESRGFVLSAGRAVRVAEAADLARVEQWLRRAVVAATVEDIFRADET